MFEVSLEATEAQFEYFKPFEMKGGKKQWISIFLNAFEWFVGEVELWDGCEKTEANIRCQDY